MATAEERLIETYFAAFNRHDIDDVMACFHPDVVVIGEGMDRIEGYDAVRLHYEREFAAVPDGRCDLRMSAGNDGRGVAESLFHGTTRDGRPIRAMGAEVIEFADGKIKEIRDYHRLLNDAEVASTG